MFEDAEKNPEEVNTCTAAVFVNIPDDVVKNVPPVPVVIWAITALELPPAA
jgi:hypothetical protein